MTYFLFAEAIAGPSGNILVALIYFLIAILICGLVYYMTKRFFPEAAFIVLAVLCIVLLVIALKLFGLF